MTPEQTNGILVFEQERKERIARILAVLEAKTKKKIPLVTEGVAWKNYFKNRNQAQ